MPRCLPILTPFLDRFFIDFYLQLRSAEPSKSLFFLWKNNVFSKNRFSKLASIFARFWCQHASIFLPKIHQNPLKNWFQDASFFRSIFASFFLRFCFDLGGQLGAMLATFSLKRRRARTSRGWFILGLSFFRFSGRPGPLLAPSGLDLGGFGPPFWRSLVPIFFTISKIFAPTFSATLALCWSIFFTKIWFVMGWWGYAKRKEFSFLFSREYQSAKRFAPECLRILTMRL